MGPLSRLAAVVLLAGSLAGRAAAHGGRGEHVHVMPPGTAGADGDVDPGVCSGTTRKAPPPVLFGPPVDLRRTPVPAEWRETWKSAGFRIDDAAGRIFRADGQPLPQGEFDRLESPFDAAAEPVEAMVWIGLMTQGARLDEKTCFFYEPDSQRPVSRLEMAAYKPNHEKGLELMGLENLRATLKSLPANKPIPADVAARLRAADGAGSVLPARALAAMARGAPAGEILADTDEAYARMTRFFDAQRDAGSLTQSALPHVPGVNDPPKPRALVGAVEEKVAAALGRDLEARFATHEAGREMLERFRGKDGVVRLPSVRVLKLSQRPDDPGYGRAGAIQDPSNGSVVLNHWVAARIAVASAPPEKRAALAAELSDAGKLNARLLKDPELRMAFIKGVEIMLAHEFIHAWQNRRGEYDIETTRGNIPPANPLEKEHEAYREQYRYFHSLLKAHPEDAVSSPEMGGYRGFLADYDAYRAAITQAYMGTFAGSSDFKTVKQVQEDRRAMARKLRSEGAAEWIRQGLKLVGLSHGDKAIQAAVDEDARRAREFRDRQLPLMRAESGRLLPKAYEAAGRPDLSLGFIVENWTSRSADGDRLMNATAARLAAATDPLHDRVRAVMAVEGYAKLSGSPAPKELAAAKLRDYVLMGDEWLANAARAPNADARRAALEAAQGFADACKDPGLLARVAAARKRYK